MICFFYYAFLIMIIDYNSLRTGKYVVSASFQQKWFEYPALSHMFAINQSVTLIYEVIPASLPSWSSSGSVHMFHH